MAILESRIYENLAPKSENKQQNTYPEADYEIATV
jgi:hypothetical protein